jgi:hypothetical protein
LSLGGLKKFLFFLKKKLKDGVGLKIYFKRCLVIQNEKTMSNTNVLTEKESFVYVDGFNFIPV